MSDPEDHASAPEIERKVPLWAKVLVLVALLAFLGIFWLFATTIKYAGA